MNYKQSFFFGSGVILFCLVQALWSISCTLFMWLFWFADLEQYAVAVCLLTVSSYFGRLGGYASSHFAFSSLCCLTMNRSWIILCWNVRGLNDKDNWSLLRNKIEESGANIFCF
jgi:hypothetical protein